MLEKKEKTSTEVQRQVSPALRVRVSAPTSNPRGTNSSAGKSNWPSGLKHKVKKKEADSGGETCVSLIKGCGRSHE